MRDAELSHSSAQAKGEAAPSFTAYLVENKEKLEISEDELVYLAGSIFGAGSDTVSGTRCRLHGPDLYD